ncbi:MAG: hypothetical protein CL678_16620 [Bdellovibrionaceae bacterium]|nr:hypothetical protein [Pseudobdellovibrionaceae bacterium]|tara:strand:+ start:1023 stop:1967 length:945 start_codon:yes stop_codon:yes gene_type:complete
MNKTNGNLSGSQEHFSSSNSGPLSTVGLVKEISQAEEELVEVPKVFDFRDYRKFLSRWLDWKKKSNPKFSGAVFARRAGLQSPTLLGMVIRKKRNLGPDTIRAFSKAIELRGKEILYFQNLVFFTQAKKSEDKAYYLEQLHSISPDEHRDILLKIKDHAKFFSRWYVVAIHQMVSIDGFNPDPEWLCKKLKRKITKKQAKEAWQILQELGMVNFENGKYKLINPGIDFHPEGIDYALRNYHKDYLDRAKDSIDGDPMEDREVSTFTLAVNDEDLEEIKQRIKKFRLALNRDFPISKNSRKSVVAFNAQLMKLTE